MRKTILFASVAVFVLAAGCSSIKVRTDHDERFSFRNFRTYGWIENGWGSRGDPAVNSPLTGRRIQNAVDSELIRRGYRRTDTGAPDFYIVYSVTSMRRTDITSTGDPYGHRYFSGYRSAWYHGVGVEAHSSHWVESTIVLDVIDASTDEVVWRGWATTDLDTNPSPDRVSYYVERAVAKILDEFPPDD
jgi:uncharacterized protein YceK